MPAPPLPSAPESDCLRPYRYFAIFIDRIVLSATERRQVRAAASVVLALVCVTLPPRAPIPDYSLAIPRYCLPDGEVGSLVAGTAAPVVPYGDGETTMAPMLWQATAGFRFRMVAGAMYTAGRNGSRSLGRSLWGTGSIMDCVMQLYRWVRQ